jgi:hypothetical protein
MSAAPATAASPPRENMLINLLFNIALPTLVLTKLSDPSYLGIKWAIAVAIAFPLGYGARDFALRGRVNLISALGLFSVLLTGGFSLYELPAAYIAVKEAAIPLMLGVATIASLRTSQPLVNTFLLNDSIINRPAIEQALAERNRQRDFDRLLVKASWLLASSFLLSSLLNYGLATYLLVAEPGTVAFNEQLGKMTALSFPVIALPATVVLTVALFYLFRGIGHITGLSFEQIIHPQAAK